MTLALMLMREDRYKEKIIKALRKSISMLPQAEAILQCYQLQGGTSNRNSLKSVNGALADLLLLTSHRSIRRIYYPLEYVMHVLNDKMTPQFSFTGKDALLLYNNMMLRYRIVVKTKAPPGVAKQAIFHGMFTQGMENLGILASITNCTCWYKRSELDSFYRERPNADPITFQGVLFNYISKMCRVLPTKIVSSSNVIATNDCKFAGLRQRHFSQLYEAYMETSKTMISHSPEPNALTASLNSYYQELKVKRREEKYQTMGTVDFVRVDEANGVFKLNNEVTLKPLETESYFFS